MKQTVKFIKGNSYNKNILKITVKMSKCIKIQKSEFPAITGFADS